LQLQNVKIMGRFDWSTIGAAVVEGLLVIAYFKANMR